MNSLSSKPGRVTVRLRALLPIVVMLAACAPGLAGREGGPQRSTDSAVNAHFTAAQQAQDRQDYAAAEREYRAVLAVSPDFAEVHMNLGLVYQLQNRSDEAMTEFRRALKIKPRLTGANFFLGVDYCKMGDGARAIPYLKAAAHEEPNRPDIGSWLATAQEMTGEIQAEVTTLKRTLDLQPRDLDLLYLLGQAYERLGKEEVVNLQRVAPGSSRAEQLLAESYAASSDWPFAVIRFRNALAATPGRLGLHVELGEVLLRAGKLKWAGEEFGAELGLDPQSLRAIVRRGELRLIEGDIDDALQDWMQATSIDQARVERILGIRETGFGDSAFEELPDAFHEKIERFTEDLRTRNSPPAHFALAFLAAQSRDFSQAAAELAQTASPNTTLSSASTCSEDEVRKALKGSPFSSVAPCGLRVLTSRSPSEFRIRVAGALLEAGDYDASLTALRGLQPSDRQSPDALYLRARCYEKLATAAYLRLYQADPNSYRVHQLIGDLDAAKGEDKDAMDEYRAAIVLRPALPNLHYSLGHLLWKDLKVADARVEFEAELALNPRHPGALNELGDTYLLEHQPDKAIPYLTRALAVNAGNPDVHRDLGTAYSELSDYQKAEAEFRIALPADHDGSVHYKLARVYQALGKKHDAAREFALSTALNSELHSKLEKQTERLNEVDRLSQDH